MTPEDRGLPNSATPIERMGDAPLESSGLHPAANKAARRAGMTPGDWFAAASDEHDGFHAARQEGIRRGIRMGARSGAYFGYRFGLEDGARSTPEEVDEHNHGAGLAGHPLAPTQQEPRESAQSSPGELGPAFGHNLGPHPMERFAFGTSYRPGFRVGIGRTVSAWTATSSPSRARRRR